MTSQQGLFFDLNAPGMTPLHRAGLTGFLASLKRMEEETPLPTKWTYQVYGDQLHLPYFTPEGSEIAQLLNAIYRIREDGLIDFPLLSGVPELLKAHIQEILLGTFLQHPRTRKAAKTKVKQVYPIDDGEVEITYLPLYDFQHRSESTANEIGEKRAKKKKIEIASWAMPGGMVRHNAAKGTALQEDPDRYFLLMFAPLGCLYFSGNSFLKNGDYDPKTQFLLGIPRPTQLQEQTDQLVDLYKMNDDYLTKHVTVLGESDATLLSAVFFHIDSSAYHLGYDFKIRDRGVRNFQVMRFGTVGWSKQQKTRTGVASISDVKMDMIQAYLVIDDELAPRQRVSQAGEKYEEVMPMRDKISENLLQERPWYHGFSEYVEDRRGKKVLSWRKELAKLVEKMEWNDAAKKQLIQLVQVAVRNRYGRVAEEAKRNNSDVLSLLDREYDRLVLTFSKCRTRESFREELVRFMAQTKANLPHLTQQERVDLLYKGAIETDWKEARDLCLLAIATYQRQDKESKEPASEGSAALDGSKLN